MKADDLQRLHLYHSPQYPGFTCWCGLWTMPDGSAICSFTQATGPFLGRPRAPAEVRRRLEWPPEGHGEEYDMTGLDLANVHLRSRDSGQGWALVGSDPFRSCMNGATGEAEVGLPDGSVMRGVWGPYLPYDEVPQDGYLQRSVDGGASWSAPEPINRNPAAAFWPKRLRLLHDGRLLAGGGYFARHPDRDTRSGWFTDFFPALYVSADGGRTWEGPIPVVATDQRRDYVYTEEFDWVELPEGELLVVLRAGVAEGRLQTCLRPAGRSWQTGAVGPNGLPYSGHPELLLTREGCLLHLATTGISWSRDQGRTWSDLVLDDGLAELRPGPATPYYPKAVQLPGGEVLVVGHLGGDDGYGRVDQSIVGLRFVLRD